MSHPPTDDDLDPAYFDALLNTHSKPVSEQPTEALALFDGFRGTDAGNAQRLREAAGGLIRYVPNWKKWIVYTDGQWMLDPDEARVIERAKMVARVMFEQAARLDPERRNQAFKWAAHSEKSSSLSAMVRLARGMPGVVTNHDKLDADPFLFNVRNGTVDLRTGELRPHDPEDLLTMQAPVVFEVGAPCPTWLACVSRWQPDKEVREFLQRSIGTALTGVPVEKLFVNIGGGGNGKSKFYGAVASVLGPFCVTPHKSLLMATKQEPHQTIVASLFRARMIVAPETSQGDRLAEEQVKNLTGGDILRARRLYEDEWSFKPTHTAFMHTNYPPRIRGTDEGIWRRVDVIRWDTTIPAAERNGRLAELLDAEASGILNWMIDGCLEWQMLGCELAEPEAVVEATNTYRQGEDHLGKFLIECCEIDPSAAVAKSDLRSCYENWCRDSGENEWTVTAFGKALGQRFDSSRVGHDNRSHWVGLHLNRAMRQAATTNRV